MSATALADSLRKWVPVIFDNLDVGGLRDRVSYCVVRVQGDPQSKADSAVRAPYRAVFSVPLDSIGDKAAFDRDERVDLPE